MVSMFLSLSIFPFSELHISLHFRQNANVSFSSWTSKNRKGNIVREVSFDKELYIVYRSAETTIKGEAVKSSLFALNEGENFTRDKAVDIGEYLIPEGI